MFGVAKKILFWSYGRTSWQYDVLSALILAFIFLTPLAWFKTGEPTRALSHQNGSKAATKLRIPAEILPTNPDKDELEKRARWQLNRSDLKVTGTTQVRDADGRIVAYEVDIE